MQRGQQQLRKVALGSLLKLCCMSARNLGQNQSHVLGVASPFDPSFWKTTKTPGEMAVFCKKTRAKNNRDSTARHVQKLRWFWFIQRCSGHHPLRAEVQRGKECRDVAMLHWLFLQEQHSACPKATRPFHLLGFQCRSKSRFAKGDPL